MISGRKNIAQSRQGPMDRRQHNESQVLEDVITAQTGLRCAVTNVKGLLFIRANDYVDYVMAKAAIKGRTSLPIAWKRA